MGRIFSLLLKIPKFFKDRSVPLWAKFIMGITILYCLIPIDLLPFLPFDDIVLLTLVMFILRKYIDKGYKSNPDDLSGNFKKENIVDDVSYHVEDEKEY